MNKLLVISPHADDAEIGCGGYIARTVAAGGEVQVVVMSVSSVKFRHRGVVTVAEREYELQNSMAVLGVQTHSVLSHNLDGNLYTAPQSQFVGMLDDIIDQFKPTEVLIPLPSSHQDHRYTWEVGIAATRPSAAKHQPTLIAAYEYPSTNWGDGSEANAGKGGLYANVTDYWDRKVEALSKYETQMRGEHHLYSIAGVTALGNLRGLEAGFGKAELFHVLRIRL